MAEMLAGGDCDGDIVQIIWEPEFIDSFIPHDPAEIKEKNMVS